MQPNGKLLASCKSSEQTIRSNLLIQSNTAASCSAPQSLIKSSLGREAAPEHLYHSAQAATKVWSIEERNQATCEREGSLSHWVLQKAWYCSFDQPWKPAFQDVVGSSSQAESAQRCDDALGVNWQAICIEVYRMGYPS